MSTTIITDGCCDLPPELCEALNVDISPLTISIENEEFLDDGHLDIRKLLHSLATHKEAPKTACPAPDEYLKRFKKSNESFCVTLSSRLSGSYNSAKFAQDILAEEEPTKRTHVFDSLSASAGQVLLVLKIREFIDNKIDFDTIVEKINAFIKEMKTYFVLENLETLMKSGRMSKITGLIAATLSLRPIMGSDGDGRIKLYEKIRGTERALIRLAEMIGEQGMNLKERILVISHCNDKERAEFFKEEVKKRHTFKDIIIVETGGTSTVFANQGGLVIAF
ncbi:MAG: DegV family protein [Bacillota bacterium]|nr:DegV family protein [Bacillota bacterium]